MKEGRRGHGHLFRGSWARTSRPRAPLACIAFAAAFFAAQVAARGADPHPDLAQLIDAWQRVNDFQATIAAHEIDGPAFENRTFHYSFLRPNHVKLEIVDGPSRGMVVTWNGGDRVGAYRRGFLSAFKLSFGVHDKTVTSLRGNTLTSPDLGPTLQCFQAKQDSVREGDGPQVDGEATRMLVLEQKDPLRCPGDSPRDLATITKDVILLSRAYHLPVRRIRFAGDIKVEEWDLHDLRINGGLSLRDFG